MARKTVLANYIANKIALEGVKQTDIADALGYDFPSIVSLFKSGKCKIPIEKIPKFAKAINVSEVVLLELAMSEYMPEVWKVIKDVVGQPVTKNEMELIKAVRSGSDKNPLPGKDILKHVKAWAKETS